MGRLSGRVVTAAGSLARDAHLGPIPAGVVKRVAAKVAATGHYTYRDRHGYVVEADLGDYMERAGFFGAHATRVIRVVRDVLQAGDWAIDAGANVGLISSEMCAAVGTGGAVWAVEPLPRNVARLEAFKAANGLDQLSIFAGALAEAERTALLRIPVTNGSSGWGSFVAPWQTSGEVPVETWRLDDLVERAGGPPGGRTLRLLKIDVEGSEPELLEGAERTLRTHRPLVVCELNDHLLRHAGTSSERLLASFAALGYRTQRPLDRPPSLDGRVVDVLLVPAG